MTNIKTFCNKYNIEKYILGNLFNNLYNILDSKKESISFINIIIESCDMSISSKKDVQLIFKILNNVASNKYFKYKKLKLIFELCPYFAQILTHSLNLKLYETRELFDKNKITVKYVVDRTLFKQKNTLIK